MNLSNSFDKLKNFMIIPYRGTLIERAGDKFKYREFTGSLDEVKKRIDQSFIHLQNSIR